ncbi:MAG: ribbon-helix-helix domain-containing protein [Magnetospirillum sp.]|nr:ribbon-helix-helix domain-containing protein [Magnetospirillum sp.]
MLSRYGAGAVYKGNSSYMAVKPAQDSEFELTDDASWLMGNEIRPIRIGKTVRSVELNRTIWVILEEICRLEGLSLHETFEILADRCRSTRAKTLGRAAEVFAVAYNRQAVAPLQRENNDRERIKPKFVITIPRVN